ncbi:MAG: epoxyqueuosine reductase QueH [Candidatus Gastranaerophilales bacterium]|nr:epoxyqueuosine reductase QueH [Candidatus Gastranaerophilales bacterium]
MIFNDEKILVHTCCAPCSTYPFENIMEQGLIPVGFFYNPNIHPQNEHDIRLNEFIDYCNKRKYELVVPKSNPNEWFCQIKGLENEPEKGKRCEICFDMRLKKTAEYAKNNGFQYFTTVLSISPHKNANLINEIGKKLEEKFGVKFLEVDFKKKNGFKKSIEISRQYGLYRQDYCGCIYSKK